MALITADYEIPDVGVLFPKTRRWHDVKPCGTMAAVRRHYRRGEQIDHSCRQAQARDKRDYRAKVSANSGKKLGGRWPEKVAELQPVA